MAVITRHLFLISMLDLVHKAVTIEQCNGPRQLPERDKMLKGHTYATRWARSGFAECLFVCREEKVCQSFNFVVKESKCEFNNRTKEACRPEDFVSDPDRLYVKLDVSRVYKNCAELYEAGVRNSGVYTIDPDNAGAFEVYCDQTTAGGGWTVFQKRLDGSVDFYLGWEDYERGFGNLNGEFWLGLDKIHRLTKEPSKLRVDLEDFDNQTAYAQYDSFGVANEEQKYKLVRLGKYAGTANDSLSYHRGMAFFTKDQDREPKNCAQKYKGAWWYNDCHFSNLNGLYLHGNHSTSFADGVNWLSWRGYHYSVKRAEMKIKPVGI